VRTRPGVTAARRPIAYSAAFEEFWTAYPRRVGKLAAWQVFARLEVTSTDLDMLLAALDWQVRRPEWCRDGGQFIPHPKTWLSQRRWEDEPLAPGVHGYRGWVCPHDPPCEARHYCALKTAKEAGAS
jgi:hypothetical protein